MLSAREYIDRAEASFADRRAAGGGYHQDKIDEAEFSLKIANACSLALIAEYLAPNTVVMEAPPDPTEFGMAVCVLKGSHDPFQAHTLIECPTYGPPSVDPWTKAVPVSDADKRS